MQAEEEVLEVDASGGRDVGGKCKRTKRCWR